MAERDGVRSLGSQLFAAGIAWFASTLFVSALLIGLVLSVNEVGWDVAHWIGIIASMTWVAAAANGAFLIVAVILLPAIRRLTAITFGSGPSSALTYFVSALAAFNLAWILWNDLQMAHQPWSVRPFITTTGILQLAGIAVATLLVFATAFLAARPNRALLAAGLLISALGLSLGLVRWSDAEAAYQRRYTTADFTQRLSETSRNASSSPGSAEHVERPPLILIGVDGLSWEVALPLMKRGALPSLLRLASSASFGYLDNGDLSYSPPIWTTIFTGQDKLVHGVHDFLKFVVSFSGRSLPDFKFLSNDMDFFYGLNRLVQRLPNLGLWSIRSVGSEDRRTPAVWEIAGAHGRQVVVVNPLVAMPFEPVKGAIVDLSKSWTRGAAAFQPPELAERWAKEAHNYATIKNEAAFEENASRLQEEVDFTLALMDEFKPDLTIFYTHFVDTTLHFNWDFHARDRFWIRDLPSQLSNEDWETLLGDSTTDIALRAHIEIDRQLGRILDRHPDAMIVLLSDHGWTFSGYEHFGAQDGMAVVAGPGVRAGEVIDSMSIQDVTPTVLAMLDVPVSREFAGRPVVSMLVEPPEIAWVEGYSITTSEPDGETSVDMDPAEAERLRAIGYIE